MDGEAGGSRQVLTVAELNRTIEAAVRGAFPSAVWVRGEVQGLKPGFAGRKHVYFELHDTGGSGAADFQIPAAILDWDRQRFGLARYLDGSDPDFCLRNELEVCLQCRVDFYPPFGKLSLKVVGIDPAYSLGRLEAQRRAVLAFLQGADLLERNAALPLPELPLRVGLITAAGSAAERDFRTGLEASPYPFAVDLVDCRMQGEQMEGQVIQALRVLAARSVDVVVITRGGGSRADLSWFDQQDLAVAVATCLRPVIAAIGHEIDRAITDAVAHTSCKTPTAAAAFLVERVAVQDLRLRRASEALARGITRRLEAARRHAVAWNRVGPAARRPALVAGERLRNVGARLESRVVRQVAAVGDGLGRGEQRLRSAARQRCQSGAVRQRSATERLAREALRPARRATDQLVQLGQRLALRRLLAGGQRQGTVLTGVAARLARRSVAVVQARSGRLELLAGQVRLLDPELLLARGFTRTRDATGRALRRAVDVAPGDRITTEFADGIVASLVQPESGGSARAPGGGGSPGRRGQQDKKGGQRDGEEARPGQETLFQ